MMRIDEIVGDDEEDTRLLNEMAAEAENYIRSFGWCPRIEAAHLADGIGGIVALFLFEFAEKIGGTDDRLWVVVGDLPSAYMVVDPGETCREALEGYCALMDDWVGAVRSGGDFSEIFPVEAPRTSVNADSLESRLALLREEIIPDLSDEPVR